MPAKPVEKAAAPAKPAETVVVKGGQENGPDPSQTPAALTVIPVDGTLPANADVAEALRGAAGVTVDRLGGLGDWASVSIRGASARQVVVMLDGIPLNPDGATAVDLSELPLRSFQRIEVYRGAAPPDLATAAMGGVVNLVTRDARTPPSVAAGAGSMRTGRLHADVAGVTGDTGGLLSVDGFTTSGVFRYFDDDATAYNLGDDRLRTRVNNDAHQANVLGRVRSTIGPVRLTVLDTLLWRDEGVPGPISVPTTTVRYGITRNLLVAQADAGQGATVARGRLWGLWREERFDDRQGQIGVGRQWTRDDSGTLGARADVRHAFGDRVVAGLTGQGRLDRYVSHDRLTGLTGPARLRWAGTFAASASVFALHDRLLVQPVVQGQGLWSVDTAGGSSSRATTLAVEPRVGVLVQPARGLSLKLNAGRYLRPPDFLELFGDRGAFVGKPDLKPEKGWQADLGARWTVPGNAVVAGTLEATGFLVESRDLIAFVQNGQRVVVPMNIGRSRAWGLEAAATLRWSRFLQTSTDLTRTVSTNLSEASAYAGKQLPRVPPWELYQRTALVPWPWLRVGHTFSYTAGEYSDATNWFQAAPRPLHGLFARVGPFRGWSVEADVLNVLDTLAEVRPRNPLDPGDPARIVQPITDFAGYPLPGRTFLLTAQWEPGRSH